MDTQDREDENCNLLKSLFILSACACGTHADRSIHVNMVMTRQLTAVIEREGDGYDTLSPELEIASQGTTLAQAWENLKEALYLLFQTASATEIRHQLHKEVYVT